jgi:hypothetical protein
MAPGVGLYLDELFFDGYNKKQDEELRKEQNKKNKKNKKSSSSAAGEEERAVGEVLRWSDDVEIKANMTDFRENVIWPHIISFVSYFL